MKPIKTALLALPLLAAGCNRDSGTAKIRPMEAGSVRVEDAFWSPRYEKWEHVTVGDMLDKFEGNDPAHFACGVDAFENFDLVASGARDIGRHAGPPWYDGLVYETIRGISDLLAQRPDPALKARVDGYIARIEAETGAKEFHTSARSIVYSKMEYRNENVPMGSSIVSSEFETVETDRKKVASYL